MASVSAFAFATHSDMDNRRLARRPAARRQGSSSSLTPRALKQLDVLDVTMQPVKSPGFDVAAWREGVAAPAALIATATIAPAELEGKRRRRAADFSLILERTFSSGEPDLSLRIPESPTQFDTPSVSGCCISSLDDHSGQENIEPVHTGPPKQDVLPVRVATRPRSAFNDVSFLETNSTLVRVFSNTLASPKAPVIHKTSLARKFSSKRPPLLEVAIPAHRATHPLDRSIKPPSSPAPFTSTLLNSQNVHPQTLAIPSKAAKLLGITPTSLPRPAAPRRSYHDEDDEEVTEDTKSESSRSSLCSCMPPRPSLGSSRSTLGGGGGRGPGSPTSTIHVRSQSPHPYSSPSSPFFTFRQQALRSKGDSSSSSPSSPYFASHDAAPARRSLPDVSSQRMLSSISFETSLTHSILSERSRKVTATLSSPRFWRRTHNSDRAASQPSDLLLFVNGEQQQRVGSVIGEESEGGEEEEEEEEEVEVLRKRKEKVARRMTRDDWADESERLRERIRQSLGY